MDHPLYAYSALPRRPPAAAGAGHGVDAFVVLCLEHWDAEPEPGSLRDPRFVGEFGSFSPDYRSWTQREYGLRIGVFRVVDALRAAGIRPAVAANARVLERLPALVDLFNDWGCEWIAHGVSASSLVHARMPLAEQRAHIAGALERVHAITGQPPMGWLSQDWGSTPDTYRLLAEAGLRYTLDWTNDDQPYAMATEPAHMPALMAVPLSAEWDDVQCQWLRHIPPREHARLTLAALDRLRTECTQHQRRAVFGLALHPWVSGMASRIAPLRQLLVDLRARQGVRWTTPGALLPTSETDAH